MKLPLPKRYLIKLFFHQGLIEEVVMPEQVLDNPQQERTKPFLSKVL